MNIQSFKKYPVFMATFGEKLSYLRHLKEFTQVELAEALKLDINRADIAGWENDRHLPSMEKVATICDYFRVTMDDMLRPNIGVKVLARKIQKISK